MRKSGRISVLFLQSLLIFSVYGSSDHKKQQNAEYQSAKDYHKLQQSLRVSKSAPVTFWDPKHKKTRALQIAQYNAFQKAEAAAKAAEDKQEADTLMFEMDL